MWKCFSCKCDQGGKNKSKKVTTEAVSNKQPKRMSEFGFLLKGIADPQNNITVPHSVRSCLRFLQIHQFILSFSHKSMTRSTPLNCLLSNQLHCHGFQIWNTAYRFRGFYIKVYFVLSKQEEHIFSSSSHHFRAKVQNKLCTHEKK